MKWQKNGVKTDEKAAQLLIVQQSARPVCVLVIGANSKLKRDMFENFLKPIASKGFNAAWIVSQAKNDQAALRSRLDLQPSDIFHIDMYGDEACNPDSRKRIITEARRLNVKTIVGLFIDSFSELDQSLPGHIASSSGMGDDTARICTVLHENPPQVDEFDVLFTVSK